MRRGDADWLPCDAAPRWCCHVGSCDGTIAGRGVCAGSRTLLDCVRSLHAVGWPSYHCCRWARGLHLATMHMGLCLRNSGRASTIAAACDGPRDGERHAERGADALGEAACPLDASSSRITGFCPCIRRTHSIGCMGRHTLTHSATRRRRGTPGRGPRGCLPHRLRRSSTLRCGRVIQLQHLLTTRRSGAVWVTRRSGATVQLRPHLRSRTGRSRRTPARRISPPIPGTSRLTPSLVWRMTSTGLSTCSLCPKGARLTCRIHRIRAR
jgi:hypothetical protein